MTALRSDNLRSAELSRVRDSRGLLGEAMRDEKALQCCACHAKTVWFDEPRCPLCVILAENKFNVVRVLGQR